MEIDLELDLRKQRILQAIVQDYIATAEPVGSQVLVERYSLGVKSATIRNEMAEMSDRGYLRQPHTSAGRVPSDRGYRFYVNRLMYLPVLQEGEVIRMQEAVTSASSEMDALLRRTCQVLAEMTRLPAMAIPPDADDTELRQIFLSPAGADKALLVLLFSTGRAENRLLPGFPVTASDALHLVNALNERFAGASLSILRVSVDTAPPPPLTRFAPAWRRITGTISETARALGAQAPVVVEGAHAAFEHPEFRDIERLGQLLSTLQERAAILEMLSAALQTNDPRLPRPAAHVRIGEEMGRPDFQEYAVVTSPYFVGQKERGAIGVVGPTRMDYARAAVAVEFMARTVSEILTRLSVAP
jgi:heat-inducible transcriptional repressor